MALGNTWTTIASGSFSSGGATLTYYIEAKLNSQSIANNTSSISTRARTVFSGYSMSSYNVHMSCTGCTPYDGNNSTIYYFSTKTVLSGSVTVSHSADGTKTFSMSGACTGNLGMNIQLSGNISLPTIPRASTPTFSANPLTIGSTQTITTNRAASSFTHTITIAVGGYTETIENVGASTTWTPATATLMPYMDTWQKDVTVTCVTYNGTTQIGSSTTSFKLQVDTSVYKPVISFGARTDTNSITAALETGGTFIKGYSNLSVVVSVSANDTTYGDKVATLKVELGNTSQTATINAATGSLTFTATMITETALVATAVDSRGVSVTQTVTLTLINYSPTIVNSVEITRVNANGVPTETGEYISYKINYDVFWGSFGQQNNTITVGSFSKAASASSFDPLVTEQTVNTSGTGAYSTRTLTGITVGTYSPSTQFDIKFVLTDKLGVVNSATIRIHEGVPVFAWGENHFDVYGDFHIHDREDVTKYTTISPKGYQWKLVGTASGTTAVNFDSSICSEIMVVVKYVENANYTWLATGTVPTGVLTSSDMMLMLTSRIAPTYANDFGAVVKVNTSSASISAFIANRTSVTAELAVYYR